MQSHQKLPYHKNKTKEDQIKKGDPNSKLNEIIENILEINLNEKEFKKSNSSSSLNKFFLNKKRKTKSILNEKTDINILSNKNEMKKDFRKNFVLKSEIYNLNRNKNIGEKNMKEEINLLKNNKAKESSNNTQIKDNFYENNMNNNNPINPQLIQNNNILNNNNINNNYIINNIQNLQGYNAPPTLYQKYSYSPNPFFNNNFYNYYNNNNIINSQYYNNHINNNNINNKNYIYLAKTQSGSKFLQEKILLNKEFANDILYPELKNNLKEIYNDIYGASLLQILFKQLRYENLNSFLSLIKDDMNNICLTEQGSHVIQSLIENIKEHPLLINKFIFNLNSKDLKKIILSPYGNHIIKCYLSFIKQKEFTNFIYNFINKNFIDVVKEKYGVCIIQQCFWEGDEKEKKQIINLIILYLDDIIKDNFGNYLIQYIFTKGIIINFESILPLIIKIEKNLVDYCKCKYSASVLEKCFEKGDEKISEHFLNYLIDNHPDDIINISANQFGFYIIKKSFYIQNVVIKQKIYAILQKDIYKLRPQSKEKRLICSLLKEYSGLQS